MQRAKIETVAEFDYCIERGHNPLVDYLHFEVVPSLRIELQRLYFGHSNLGKGDVVRGNQRFYEFMWEVKPHICEECMKPLPGYSSVFISHILSRGGHSEMAHDCRNVNILCFKCHSQWETGRRVKMRIYERNMLIIERLKRDYSAK